MRADSPAVKRRWFPRVRFSLRTLLLFVLLIASGGTLWWNWGPWGVAYAFHTEGYIKSAAYSADNRFILINSVLESKSAASPGKSLVDIRFAGSGGVCREIRLDYDRCSAEIVDPYVHVLQTHDDQGVDRDDHFLYRLDSGAPFSPAEQFPQTGALKNIHFHQPYAVLYFQSQAILVEFPSFREIMRFPSAIYVGFSASNKFVAVECKMDEDYSHLKFFALDKKERIWNPEQEYHISEFCYPRDDVFYVCSGGDTAQLNPLTAKVVRKFPGVARVFSADGMRCAVVKEPSMRADPSGRGRTMLDTSLRSIDSNDAIRTIPDSRSIEFSEDGRLLLDPTGRQMLDGRTGETLWQWPDQASFSPNCEHVLVSDGHWGYIEKDAQTGKVLFDSTPKRISYRIVNARTGGTEFDFENLRDRERLPSSATVSFSNDSSGILTYDTSWKATDCTLQGEYDKLLVWKQRRPVAWYGVAWLPEFWLTVVFGAGLIWSIWRDRMALRK